ncbi:MAG: hypothetical protein COB36_09715 [Alphaproteobacteria bacterium]|nr:MAG: hypothetical protein COB36_09715 [Alphaproteobacteria bacterium]
MRKKLYFLPLFLIMSLCHIVIGQAIAKETSWTEKKLGKIIIKADKAAGQKKWSRAIKYGEQMLRGSHALDQHSDARYINLLKNLNRYYDKSNRLKEISPRIEEAYLLSQKHLGAAHETTITSRLFYYKILISQKKYPAAITLVQQSIVILKKNREDKFKLLHYLKQLYSLYGRTELYAKEEETLLKLLKLNKQLLGEDLKENITIILSLARTYCLQKKNQDFDKLMEEYNLDYQC